MTMTLKEIQSRIEILDNALTEKNYPMPECDLTIEASGDASVWIKSGKYGDAYRVFESIEGNAFSVVFDAADKFVFELPDMADHKKAAAVKVFGRAVDGLRDAGIDAKFVDPMSDALKAMSENLLTHQPEATP